jgi:hypothetical protein
MMPKFFRNTRDNTYSLRGEERPSKLIFAEGEAEAWFLEAWLCSEGRNPRDVAVICFKGKSRLKPVLMNIVSDENFGSVRDLGFFVDAEEHDAKHTVASICAALIKNEVIEDATNLNIGFQVVGDRKVSLFISPDNKNPGCIEDMVVAEIASSSIGKCLQKFDDCVQQKTGMAITQKACVQAFLGIQQKGLAGTGHGFMAKKLDVTHDAYTAVRDTLGKLFL